MNNVHKHRRNNASLPALHCRDRPAHRRPRRLLHSAVYKVVEEKKRSHPAAPSTAARPPATDAVPYKAAPLKKLALHSGPHARKGCRRPYHVAPEAFYTARWQGGYSLAECAALLHVSPRTVRYWEGGARRIPYAAFRLLRVISGRTLPWPGWQDFMVVGGYLVSPEGHRFGAGDLAWLSLTCRLADAFRGRRLEADARVKTGDFVPSSHHLLKKG